MELNSSIGMKMPFLSGAVVDLADLSTIDNLTIEDIAIGLARENRYYGQTRKGPYSVAQHVCLATHLYVQHSLFNSDHFYQLDGPIAHHDDPEVITGDIPKQVKRWLGKWYDDKEAELHVAFNNKFDLKCDPASRSVIKNYDLMALNHELSQFTYQFEFRSDLPRVIDRSLWDFDEYSYIWDEQKSIDKYLEAHYKWKMRNSRPNTQTAK